MSRIAIGRSRKLFTASEDIVSAPRSWGEPLPSETKSKMEYLFRQDFSTVRVHTDDAAARSASAMGASAYTLGHDIYFGSDRFDLKGAKGRRLFAHELTHTLQVGHVGNAPKALRLGASDSTAEREANVVSRMAGHGSSVPDVAVRGDPMTVYRAMENNVEEEEDGDDSSSVEQALLDPSEAHDGDNPVSVSTQFAAEEDSAQPELLASAATTVATSSQSAASRTITRIDVDLSSQMLRLVWSDGKTDPPHKISSGRGRPNTANDPCEKQTEENCTPVGDFKVGMLGDANTRNSKKDKMSWYVGFVDSRGIGIHDSQPAFGFPHSHGCVRVGMKPEDDAFAKLINQHVVSGTTIVHVTGKALTKPYRDQTYVQKKKRTKRPPVKKP